MQPEKWQVFYFEQIYACGADLKLTVRKHHPLLQDHISGLFGRDWGVVGWGGGGGGVSLSEPSLRIWHGISSSDEHRINSAMFSDTSEERHSRSCSAKSLKFWQASHMQAFPRRQREAGYHDYTYENKWRWQEAQWDFPCILPEQRSASATAQDLREAINVFDPKSWLAMLVPNRAQQGTFFRSLSPHTPFSSTKRHVN